MLHLSTRWGFSSIRRLALSHIEPPTPHDRLLLARTYSISDWVVPALSALCERTTPLSLSEARQMIIEDVVLVSTVREHIRGATIQVDAAEIPLCVEAEQSIALGHPIPSSSSRESRDDSPMAGAWYPRSCQEKAEAKGRVKAQEAARLRLDAGTKEGAEAEDKARQEAEVEKARLFAVMIRKESEEACLKAEKARNDSEEKDRLEAEKARKDEYEKVCLEAEKARDDEEKKARLEVEEKKRKDAEDKARAKKAKMAAVAAAKKREADAKPNAAEAETKRQAEAEAEKMTREAETKAEAEAKATKRKLEAEAKAGQARIKAKEVADREAEAKSAETKPIANLSRRIPPTLLDKPAALPAPIAPTVPTISNILPAVTTGVRNPYPRTAIYDSAVGKEALQIRPEFGWTLVHPTRPNYKKTVLSRAHWDYWTMSEGWKPPAEN